MRHARRRRRRAPALVLALTLALQPPGCAWTLAVATSHGHTSDPLGARLVPAMPGTSVHLSAWARVVRGDGEHLSTHVLFPLLFLPVFVIDFPLSLAVDVLLLPIAIPLEVSHRARQDRRRDAPPGSAEAGVVDPAGDDPADGPAPEDE